MPELTDSTPNDLLTRLFARARENIAAEAAEGAADAQKYQEAMEQVREIMASVADAGSATEAANAVRRLPHALSSEREARAMLAAKAKELGIKWDKAAGAYV